MLKPIVVLLGLFGVGAGCAPPDTIERPMPPLACGPVLPWVAGGRYARGNRVTAGFPVHVFECRPWPYEGWCPMAAYEPARRDGPWLEAWMDVGPCPKDMLRVLDPESTEPH